MAYLTEGWAARFVTELFRNYTVCFVGYSIDDPILRYMLDALAAERLLGEPGRKMFAFAPYGDLDESQVRANWKARHVEPILYRVGGADENDHSHLHSTLRAWGDIYRDGIGGKRSLVVAHAHSHPVQSTTEDDLVGRMLWALSDPSGGPASALHTSTNRHRSNGSNFSAATKTASSTFDTCARSLIHLLTRSRVSLSTSSDGSFVIWTTRSCFFGSPREVQTSRRVRIRDDDPPRPPGQTRIRGSAG